jgi:DNA polymerase III epsilon subunit-like protein
MVTSSQWQQFTAWFKQVLTQQSYGALPEDIKTLQQGLLGGAHKQRRLWQCEFVALDLETSGLSARQHQIVSSASVLIRPVSNTHSGGNNITSHITDNIKISGKSGGKDGGNNSGNNTCNSSDIARQPQASSVSGSSVHQPSSQLSFQPSSQPSSQLSIQLSMQLSSAVQHLLQQTDASSVGQSALIHGYHDRDLQQGLPRRDYLYAILQMLQGRVLVCHNADIEVAFLQQAFMQQFGTRCPLVVIDTMRIEQRRLAHQPMLKYNELTLASCLQRYHLPQSRSHDALSDAYSCALLWLAQSAGQLDTPLADWAKLHR